MLNILFRLFHNLDYFAECASNADMQKYKNVIRSKHIFSHDGSEEGAYFCAVPKMYFNTAEMAVSTLFINCLYEFEGWSKDTPFDISNRDEWKECLKKLWIPEYFACGGASFIEYKQVDCMENLPIADQLLTLAVPSPAIQIIRYGMIHAWNFFDYFIETETEYIDFQSWTTA